MKKVLIIEDSECLCELIGERLRSSIEANIYYAQNGNEGIAILKEQKIDLVICDYEMPEANGKDVLQFIINSKFDIPFFLFSASKEMETYKSQYAHYQFVHKEDLLELIEVVVKTNLFPLISE